MIPQPNQESIICTYRKYGYGGGTAAIIIGSVFAGIPAYHWLFHPDTPVTFIRPAWAAPLMFGMGLFLILCSVAWLMQGRKECISVIAGRIVWTDYRGRERLRCTFADVIPGTFKEVNAQTRMFYSVSTPGGILHWTSDISYCDQLTTLIRGLARQTQGASS